MPDHFLNYSQVAELLGLEVETLKKGKAGTRDIPRIKLGSRVLFSFNAVQRWMAAQARKAEEDRRRRETVVIDLYRVPAVPTVPTAKHRSGEIFAKKERVSQRPPLNPNGF